MYRLMTALLFSAALVPLAGCSKGLTPVSGSVTLDGKTVAGAAVTFTSSDGKHIASGMTDDAGNFTLNSPNGPGAYAGSYKVTVAKYPKVEGGVPNLDAGKADKAYEATMKKQMEASKAPIGAKMPAPKGGGMMPPGGMMPIPGGASAHSSTKSELPEVYASIEKTPLTVTVPAEGVKLELKSK